MESFITKKFIKITKKNTKNLINLVKKEEIEMDHLHDEHWENDNELSDCLFDGNSLYFNEDHYEHIDYLSHNEKLINFLKKEKVKGNVKFGCLDGDQFGQFWGYHFDGSGSMKLIKGSLSWK